MSWIAHAAAFGGVIVLGAMTPGPDLAVVIRRSAMSGRQHGFATAAGVATGVFVWLAIATTGIAALLAASATAFTVVKIVGAAYLAFLAIKAFRSARRQTGAADMAAGDVATTRLRGSYVEGFFTNLLNPKAGLFFIALVPQFLGTSPALMETVPMAGVAATAAGIWFIVVATAVSALRRVFARPRVRAAMDAIMGTTLLALGVKLATSPNP